jgi:hypothetical protein
MREGGEGMEAGRGDHQFTRTSDPKETRELFLIGDSDRPWSCEEESEEIWTVCEITKPMTSKLLSFALVILLLNQLHVQSIQQRGASEQAEETSNTVCDELGIKMPRQLGLSRERSFSFIESK